MRSASGGLGAMKTGLMLKERLGLRRSMRDKEGWTSVEFGSSRWVRNEDCLLRIVETEREARVHRLRRLGVEHRSGSDGVERGLGKTGGDRGRRSI